VGVVYIVSGTTWGGGEVDRGLILALPDWEGGGYRELITSTTWVRPGDGLCGIGYWC
jgi:hypothetical protein